LRNNNTEDVDEAGVCRMIEIINVLNKKWQYNWIDKGHCGWIQRKLKITKKTRE